MAAIERASAPRTSEHSDESGLAPKTAPAPAYPPLGWLRALHAEAEETARLANLLGRTLYIAVALSLGAVIVIASAGSAPAREIAWGLLVAIAAGAVIRAYRHTISAPFERAALRSFAQDLNAIVLYAGCAWGAGAFLSLSAEANPIITLLFTVGMTAGIAALLRKTEPVLHFTAPVAILGIAAVLLRALPGFAMTAIAIALGCGAVAGAAILLKRRSEAGQDLPQIPNATLA